MLTIDVTVCLSCTNNRFFLISIKPLVQFTLQYSTRVFYSLKYKLQLLFSTLFSSLVSRQYYWFIESRLTDEPHTPDSLTPGCPYTTSHHTSTTHGAVAEEALPTRDDVSSTASVELSAVAPSLLDAAAVVLADAIAEPPAPL